MKFNREVNLTGEAFFEVEKQIGQKFIVKTNCLSIEVLGTKFNVNSTNKEAEVTLNEGIIHLFNFALPQVDVYMRPNEYVLYNSKQNKLVTQAINANINSIWKEGQINFKDFNLSEISQIIQKIYKKQVIINNKSLLNKTLSGTAPSDDLNIILKGLSEIMGGDIKIVNDTILIN
jgi:ferric-dicitrate binding protein FerR (iron transport regulator)